MLVRPVIQRDTALVLLTIGTGTLLGLFTDGIPLWVRVAGFPLALFITVWSILQLHGARRTQRKRDQIVSELKELIHRGQRLWRDLAEPPGGRELPHADWKGYVEDARQWVERAFGPEEAADFHQAALANVYGNQADGKPGYTYGAVMAHYRWLERALVRFVSGTLLPMA